MVKNGIYTVIGARDGSSRASGGVVGSATMLPAKERKAIMENFMVMLFTI